MTRTRQIKHNKNETVPYEINKRRIMSNAIMKRKINLIGYLLRHNLFIFIIVDVKTKANQINHLFGEISQLIRFISHQKFKKTAIARHK